MSTIALRHLAEVNPPSPDFDRLPDDAAVLFLPLETVWSDDRADQTRFVPKGTVDSGYTRFQAGDTVCPKVTPTFQAGRSMRAQSVGAGTTELHVLRARAGVDPRWITYAVRSKPFLEEGVAAFQGVAGLQRVPHEFVADFRVADVHSEEQRRIADFLDHRVAQIDQITAAREQQVRLLDEERRSVAERLAWQGLEQDEPRSRVIDSSLPSPARWTRLPNRYLLREASDLSQSGDEELLTVSHLTGVSRRADKSVNMFMAESLEGYKLVQRNDLVINTLWAWMGALAVSPMDGIVSPAYGVYRPVDAATFHPGYYNELYRSSAYICEMTRHSKGVWSSRLRLYPDSFLALPSVHPAIHEQAAIYHEIERAVGQNTARITALLTSMALLAEYKQSLITAAVTCGLDVTTAGSGIPG